VIEHTDKCAFVGLTYKYKIKRGSSSESPIILYQSTRRYSSQDFTYVPAHMNTVLLVLFCAGLIGLKFGEG
jgi:hypothetical protein